MTKNLQQVFNGQAEPLIDGQTFWVRLLSLVNVLSLDELIVLMGRGIQPPNFVTTLYTALYQTLLRNHRLTAVSAFQTQH